MSERDEERTRERGWTHDLELYRLALELDGADLEVDADGRDVRLCVGVVGKAEEEARLADARVADEEELEEEVVLGLHGGGGGCWVLLEVWCRVEQGQSHRGRCERATRGGCG